MRPRKLGATLIVATICVVPLVTLAQTDDIRAKLESLLARVAALRALLEQASAGGTAASSTAEESALVSERVGLPAGLPCLSISRTLGLGDRGDDVRELQRFLIAADMLEAGNDTGYFGPLTEAAVKRWQVARGVVSSGDATSTGFGLVGPRTRASILASCPRVSIPSDEPTCPVIPAPTAACAGEWVEQRSSNGCLAGFQCIASGASASATTSVPSVSVRYATTTVTVRAPAAGTAVTGGGTLRISWESVNPPPGASVALSLQNVHGDYVGVIARGRPPTGSYDWPVPRGSSGCSAGESVIDCIARIASCAGSICSVEPGTYAVIATLGGSVTGGSALFQIVGTALTSAGESIGAAPPPASPLPPPPPPPTTAATTTGGMCTHNSYSYPEGTTISVPCVAGSCLGETSGYITGICKAGKWCIPGTTYCAETFATIDVSAYSAKGSTNVQSGYSSRCPYEGWRAYLSCPMGSCQNGWHQCRGGTWVYDSDQTVSGF